MISFLYCFKFSFFSNKLSKCFVFNFMRKKTFSWYTKKTRFSFCRPFRSFAAIFWWFKVSNKSCKYSTRSLLLCFFIASILSLVLSLTSWTVIPLNHEFVFSDNNFSILFILAVSSLNVYTILFSGWASNSKYVLLSSVRAGAQMVSYEIPMSLSLFPIIITGNSFSFQNIVFYQIEKNVWNYYIIPALFVFFCSSTCRDKSNSFWSTRGWIRAGSWL